METKTTIHAQPQPQKVTVTQEITVDYCLHKENVMLYPTLHEAITDFSGGVNVIFETSTATLFNSQLGTVAIHFINDDTASITIDQQSYLIGFNCMLSESVIVFELNNIVFAIIGM